MSTLRQETLSWLEPATSSASLNTQRNTSHITSPVNNTEVSQCQHLNTQVLSSDVTNTFSTTIPSTSMTNSNFRILVNDTISPDTATPSAAAETKPEKSNKPKISRLRQQKLNSWQPTLNAKTVIPAIFLIAIIFVPVGIALLVANESVKEWIINYGDICSTDTCSFTFTIKSDFTGDVFFYYSVHNYFQNHRRYLKSRNDNQLLGKLTSTTECDPYDKANTTNGIVPIAPCGAIANSMFNDTFVLYKNSVTSIEQVPWTYKGVVWDVDLKKKFKNPIAPNGGDLCSAFIHTSKPLNWIKSPCQLDELNPDNNGFLNADFIVWMRTAAFPNLRKPYRKLVRTGTFANGLPAGNYILNINNTYPAKQFNGHKHFVISTVSWAGGKNPFLGIIYVVVGGICFLVGFIFIFIHLKWGRSH